MVAKKVDFSDSRKLIPKDEHSFQIFLVIFRLIEHKNMLFGLFYQRFFFENPILPKFIPMKWINTANSQT